MTIPTKFKLEPITIAIPFLQTRMMYSEGDRNPTQRISLFYEFSSPLSRFPFLNKDSTQEQILVLK
jgi:hypothetical protein